MANSRRDQEEDDDASAGTAKFWVNGHVPPAVAHYVRAVLVRTIEARQLDQIWPLLSMMYDLDETPPRSFSAASDRARVEPAAAVSVFTDWARRHARSTAFGHLSTVAPDPRRVVTWLAKRVMRPAYERIFTRDLETQLVLAQAADIAEATASWRAANPNQLPLPVLLFGASGTGKELLAKAMHEIHIEALASGWKTKSHASFGPVNCAGLPPHIIESELFGHKRGAFTGAQKDREGLIAQHRHGTVFLDEIGDTPAEVQLRLLRFLNDGEARPVGADRPVHHHPWVIAATHRDLATLVAQGVFRDDLFNRLNGHVLVLKTLRERGNDMFGALGACIDRYAGRHVQISISVPAEHALAEHAWTANLRAVDQLARRLVQERAPIGDHLSIDLGDLTPAFQVRYFASTSYMARLVHQYAEELKLVPTAERASLRAALVRHFHSALSQGVAPEMRFVRAAATFATSPLVRKLVDNAVVHDNLVRAAKGLEARMIQQRADALERALLEVEGLKPPAREQTAVEAVPDLPPWARRVLTLVEELSVRPEALDSLRKLEAMLERFTPTLRAVIGDLLATAIEDARKGEIVPAPDIDDADRPLWRDVRDDKTLFATWLKRAGSAKAMGDLFEKDERTIRLRATKLGLAMPNARKNAR